MDNRQTNEDKIIIIFMEAIVVSKSLICSGYWRSVEHGVMCLPAGVSLWIRNSICH